MTDGVDTALLMLWPPALGPIVQEMASRFFVRHRPLCVYLPSTWRNRTWPNLPGLPPPYLHTVSDQILEVGTAWERGYSTATKELCVRKSMQLLFCSPQWWPMTLRGHEIKLCPKKNKTQTTGENGNSQNQLHTTNERLKQHDPQSTEHEQHKCTEKYKILTCMPDRVISFCPH